MKRIIVPLAEGFEEVEALIIVDILRRGGVEVVTASITENQWVVSAHQVKIQADQLSDKIHIEEFDGVVLPGGMPGTVHLVQSDWVKETVVSLNQNNKLVAAICAAPWVLEEAGITKGKQVTCHKDHIHRIQEGVYMEQPWVKDGNIITSRGLGTAIAFSLQLVEQLVSKEKSDEIATAIIYLENGRCE